MKRWYVVQVYAGYEDRVLKDIQSLIEKEDLGECFGELLIPSAKLKSLFEVNADSKDHQLFPGYLIVEMEMVPPAMRLVLSSPRVVRFLGGQEPTPLSKKEIDRIISQMRGEIEVATEKEEFVHGSEVEITDGPFTGFVGIIERVDKENEKLTVMVSIFGRMTPVELGFHQVKQ